MRETTTNSPLFAWGAFALKGIVIRNDRINVNQANLVRPLGQVVVLPDRSFNFAPLMPPRPLPRPPDRRPPPNRLHRARRPRPPRCR
jgi:hypothetical protein